jgi:hypothetical protein
VEYLPSKRRILKKERGQGLKKKKRWNLSWKAPRFEKRKGEDKTYKLLGVTLSKEGKKWDHDFL